MTDEPHEPKVHEVAMTAGVKVSASAEASVERGLNELRLAVLGILVGIGLAVGFGVSAWWPARVAAGFGAFGAACLLIRWKRSRHWLMEFMHRLTGE